MIERPQNIRPAGTLERTHNSRRHAAEHHHREDTQQIARAYRGSHRAERMHRAEDTTTTAAFDRSSRVGRHHAPDRNHDRSNRW